MIWSPELVPGTDFAHPTPCQNVTTLKNRAAPPANLAESVLAQAIESATNLYKKPQFSGTSRHPHSLVKYFTRCGLTLPPSYSQYALVHKKLCAEPRRGGSREGRCADHWGDCRRGNRVRIHGLVCQPTTRPDSRYRDRFVSVICGCNVSARGCRLSAHSTVRPDCCSNGHRGSDGGGGRWGFAAR